jgi:hypothetical protein
VITSSRLRRDAATVADYVQQTGWPHYLISSWYQLKMPTCSHRCHGYGFADTFRGQKLPSARVWLFTTLGQSFCRPKACPALPATSPPVGVRILEDVCNARKAYEE